MLIWWDSVQQKPRHRYLAPHSGAQVSQILNVTCIELQCLRASVQYAFAMWPRLLKCDEGRIDREF
jgi:hypothetical protein